MKDKLQITAYEVVEEPMALQTAQRARDWIEALPDRFAYRCLPLAIANQVGWEILNPVPFTARWNGKEGLDAISIKFHEQQSALIGSHFGHGVLTFSMGYLFRTTKSHNLWVKGPANLPKEKDEPIATVLPYPRHYVRKFDATLKNLNENPKLYQQYVDWRDDRMKFNEELQKSGTEANKQGWQRTYMKGQDQSGNTFAGHETKVQMKDFKKG
jgi:hypothetical protein